MLEHPADSNAWAAFDLLQPRDIGWCRSLIRPNEWTCEVWQSAYGHPARKRTWLLCVSETAPPELDWRRVAGTHQVGWFDRIKPTLNKREASATPVAFRDALIGIARSVEIARRAA